MKRKQARAWFVVLLALAALPLAGAQKGSCNPDPVEPEPASPTGHIDDAAISWASSPDGVVFTWTATDLNPALEYWVYPDVGFTENGGPFGSTPEDEASDLAGMHDMAVTHYRPAADGTGTWSWYGGKPSNPAGTLALLAYDPAAGEAYVVDISDPIDTSAW